MNSYIVEPIGFIRSTVKGRADAPRQGPEGAPDATLEIEPRFAEALLGMEVWTLFDFVFAGTLIFGTGLLFEVARKKAAGNGAYKLAAGAALAAVFFLIWINGAVGIIGSETNPLNLMYFGVVGIAFLGALIARFRPQGMARALFAAAIAQAIIPVIALVGNPQVISTEAPGVVGVLALNSCFVILFVGSALLFRRASATRLAA
jgi:hypothetical protein